MLGGNLYKVERVNRARYDEIVNTLLPILDKHFGKHYRIPIPYHTKPSYGDVDIILDGGFLVGKEWEESLINDLGNPQMKRVQNVLSLNYMNFQVDFFTALPERFESTYNFMCYNILGNLIGRLYHKFNLKYGEDGVKYVLRGFNNHISEEITLSRDMKTMLEFVDLSYERWQQGFNTLKDIFDYVIGSKYFCSSSYSDDYYSVRKRQAQRPDFNAFVDYITENKIDKNYPFDKDKEVYLPEIHKAFPEANLLERYYKHVRAQELQAVIARKFNGKIIMGLLPIDGKELGKFIDTYKNYKGDDFEEFILESPQPKIDYSIVKFYNRQKSN